MTTVFVNNGWNVMYCVLRLYVENRKCKYVVILKMNCNFDIHEVKLRMENM